MKPTPPVEKPPVGCQASPSRDGGVSDKSVEKAMSPAPTRSKPFPWPILLIVLAPLAAVGALMVPWQQQDHILLFRIGWISLSAILPGFGLMAVLGGLWQIRRRPVFSSLAILLAGSMTALCFWMAQRIAESNWIE